MTLARYEIALAATHLSVLHTSDSEQPSALVAPPLRKGFSRIEQDAGACVREFFMTRFRCATVLEERVTRSEALPGFRSRELLADCRVVGGSERHPRALRRTIRSTVNDSCVWSSKVFLWWWNETKRRSSSCSSWLCK
jgi:hypothetical protein